MARPTPAFRVTLENAGRLEDLPITEIADFLRGISQIVSHGAAEELHRPRGRTGRPEALVEDAARLRLVSLRSGSVVAEVLGPDVDPAQEGLALCAETLTDRAFGRAMRVAEGHVDESPGVATAFADLLDRLAHHQDAAIRIDDIRPASTRGSATVRVADRRRLREVVRPHAADRGAQTVSGWLYAADMKALTARVRTAANETIDVAFGQDQKLGIKQALDDQASLRGEVVYDDASRRVRSIRAVEVLAGNQLELGEVDFWSSPSLDDLAAQQGTPHVVDPAELALDGVSDLEWDAFFTAMDLAD